MSAGEIKDSVSLLPCFYFVELPILVSSMVSLYFLEWTDVFKPVKFGFTCHDRSLNLPFVDPNHEVVPLLMLFSLAFAGPAIMIMIGEAVLFCCQSWKKCSVRAEVNINAAGCNFNSFIRRALRFIGVHVFGLCATALITDVLQLMTGLPTPYFLTVCKPNYTTLNITCEQNPYVLQDICSGDDPVAISQGRKSFPSQHATLASFAAVYISMYFNSTLTDSSKLLKPLLVFFFTICAIICGLTRIIQYKNHAIDVYLGFLLGGGIAVYLGLYAVGNFQPSEELSHKPMLALHTTPCTLPHISKEAMLYLMQIKANMAGETGVPASEGQLLRGCQKQRTDVHNNGHSRADAEGITIFSPGTKDAALTFSHTLPRVHTPMAMAPYEENARHHAATLHHSKDSCHSRQLLSQWKNKNNLCPMQMTDSFSSCVDSSSVQHLQHHGSMEFRSSSEPSAMAPNEGHAFISNLATGASTTLPSNCSSITGGARISLQSRPGSSQLVHIPEESQDNTHTGSLRSVSRGDMEELSRANSTIQVNWKRTRNTTVCGIGEKAPRIMQVKQQGLLQAQSQSLDESSLGCSNTAICKSPLPIRSLNDQDLTSTTEPMSSGSTTGGAIVRVKAHPEMGQSPSTDCGASWRWQSLDSSTETTGGPVLSPIEGTGSLKRSFHFNNINSDLESGNLLCQVSTDGKRANNVVSPTPILSNPPVITLYSENRGQPDHGFETQHLSTIRVNTGDGCSSGDGGGGGSEGAGGSLSETLSIGSSHESSLRRKGNIILIPERANSPDNARNVFYKGTSMTPVFKD